MGGRRLPDTDVLGSVASIGQSLPKAVIGQLCLILRRYGFVQQHWLVDSDSAGRRERGMLLGNGWKYPVPQS